MLKETFQFAHCHVLVLLFVLAILEHVGVKLEDILSVVLVFLGVENVSQADFVGFLLDFVASLLSLIDQDV